MVEATVRGENVTVIRYVETGKDVGNNPIFDDIREKVGNVLVGPPDTADAGGERPNGITVDLNLSFPRDYTGEPLRGCDIIVRGCKYKVVGDPQPVDGGLTPTAWNMSVKVFRSEG